ncbi:hypothetical protein GPAL_2988 [Glaciecola pallidula DSM 14239 = ACAM 615]|uniref:Uncharacterized protein n=1 Tax=Brumicola pallidula DSM 14239 = ACAM 615 TaxID=1121922 RepID=K6YAT6_9ALTE|nr:hypothetical protein GPAL_2988 [Glaciecola pallidula DSM 14239 = ACAM 615]
MEYPMYKININRCIVVTILHFLFFYQKWGTKCDPGIAF